MRSVRGILPWLLLISYGFHNIAEIVSFFIRSGSHWCTKSGTRAWSTNWLDLRCDHRYVRIRNNTMNLRLRTIIIDNSLIDNRVYCSRFLCRRDLRHDARHKFHGRICGRVVLRKGLLVLASMNCTGHQISFVTPWGEKLGHRQGSWHTSFWPLTQCRS